MSFKYTAPPEKQAVFVFQLTYTLMTLFTATAICEVLYQLGIAKQGISVVMVLAVFVVAAITDGYWFGLIAALAGVFAYDYLITEPRLGFSFTLGFPITLSVMLLVTLVTSSVTAKIKRQATIARIKEQKAELLYEINRKMLSSRSVSTIVHHATTYLNNDLQRSVVLYTSFDNPERLGYYVSRAKNDANIAFFSSEIEQSAARLALQRREPVGIGGVPQNGVMAFYRPIITQERVYGILGISCQQGPIEESHKPFIDLIVEQTAQALRVQALTHQQQEALVMAETEKNRNTVLRSISHDLRTPLTSIIGSSATFLDHFRELPDTTQVHLVTGIQSDAQWLMSMVENILSVTRIQQNNMVITKTEEAAEEIIAQAVSAFRKRYPAANILIEQPRNLLLVPMDALLITQVINNLLDNAQRHSGDLTVTVTIKMLEENGYVKFSISDTGPGIRADLLPVLFEMRSAQHPQGADASRGLGIGLSICKTIIEAHGGWIEAQNLPEGGACVSFWLPMYGE